MGKQIGVNAEAYVDDVVVKTKNKPVMKHSEPYVRDAFAIALLKTEDPGFVPLLDEVLKAEGDKVEYASAMKEYKAISSYLSSVKK